MMVLNEKSGDHQSQQDTSFGIVCAKYVARPSSDHSFFSK